MAEAMPVIEVAATPADAGEASRAARALAEDAGVDEPKIEEMEGCEELGNPLPVAPSRGDGPAERRAHVELPEPEEDEGPTYYRMGPSAEYDHEYQPDDCEEIHFQCTRIRKLENLEAAGPRVKRIILIANCIEKIENLETNVNLEHLELYQNLLKKIDNINHLTKLTCLDLSFNKIRSMAYLEKCPFPNLETLYLSSNKIEDMVGIFHLTNIKLLELGSNRLREVPADLGKLVNLEQLWLGKNKIGSMALPPLPKLKMCSMQNNRLEVWHSSFFENASTLTHLYLGFNNLPNLPEEFGKLVNLLEIDLARNPLTEVPTLPQLVSLQDLWMNDCQVADIAEVAKLSFMSALKTIYLERNPFHGLGDAAMEAKYNDAIMKACPEIKQIDAVRVNTTVVVITDGTEKSIRGIRKR